MNKSSYDPVGEMFTNLHPISLVFLIIGLIFFLIGIAYIVRLWFVQTATFEIQRDLAEIKDHLLKTVNKDVSTAPANMAGSSVDQNTTPTQPL